MKLGNEQNVYTRMALKYKKKIAKKDMRIGELTTVNNALSKLLYYAEGAWDGGELARGIARDLEADNINFD